MCRCTSEKEGQYAQPHIVKWHAHGCDVWHHLKKNTKIVFVNFAVFGFRSDHYGFVTFYNMNDAFAAIDNGSKLRRPDELPFDLCFGGRRQFCNSDYADLGKIEKSKPSK